MFGLDIDISDLPENLYKFNFMIRMNFFRKKVLIQMTLSLDGHEHLKVKKHQQR
jgi:hypothetical protein